jgi:O-methyltransferase/methyltransferase family protein
MKISKVTPDRIIEIGHGYQRTKTLLSAVELGVFTVLAEGSADLDTLGKQLAIHKRGARDFLDALVALGLLERHDDGRYTNTPETDLYLDRHKPTYVGGLLESINARHYAIWGLLTSALRTGMPQSGTRGISNYPALYADQTALDTFVKGMTGRTLLVAKAMTAKFPWRDYKTVIDVGAAQGCLLVEIAQVHQHISGIGFDLPPVRSSFEGYVGERGLSHRLVFHPGDFFQDRLPTADALILGRVLHNWDLATKRMLLQKAHDALPHGGALIVYEALIDDERRVNVASLLSSLNMLLMTGGGFDYTGADCIGWMEDAGFRDIRVEPLADAHSMVIGVK